MKVLFASLGILSLCLGILGIFLPLLPTTPFLLLSAALFAKSSARLYMWLIQHRIFGKYIRSYRENKSIPLKVKVFALLMLWGTMIYAIFFILNHRIELQLLLASIAIAVSIHIISLKNNT